MNLEGKRIGFGITGAFYSFRKTIEELKNVIKLNAKVIPIMTYNAYNIDTKYGKAKDFLNQIEHITNEKVLTTIQEAEKICSKDLLDIMVVAPATGNTIAKLANDIIDGPVTMAVKSHLKKEKPVVIAVSTNTGLSSSAENIGKLLNRKNYYFVPFLQDNPITKPRSIVFDHSYLIKTIEQSLDKEQIQPIIL